MVVAGAGASSQALVIGAGGGAELTRLSAALPGWRFAAVDPSAEMLALARPKIAPSRALFVQGLAHDAPDSPFDAATALLTLHSVPNDGERLAHLRAIRTRLKPGAPLKWQTVRSQPSASRQRPRSTPPTPAREVRTRR